MSSLHNFSIFLSATSLVLALVLPNVSSAMEEDGEKEDKGGNNRPHVNFKSKKGKKHEKRKLSPDEQEQNRKNIEEELKELRMYEAFLQGELGLASQILSNLEKEIDQAKPDRRRKGL